MQELCVASGAGSHADVGSVRNFVCEAVHHTAGFVNRPS
jgi:hypothetical protein